LWLCTGRDDLKSCIAMEDVKFPSLTSLRMHDASSSESSTTITRQVVKEISIMDVVRARLRTANVKQTPSTACWLATGMPGKMERPGAQGVQAGRRRLPLRIAVSILIVSAILVSSLSLFAYLSMQWSSAHAETLSLLSDSLHDQGISLHSHIAESSHAAYDFLLLNIEWSVWWFVVQPPSQAVQFMFGLLKTVPMDVGWTQWSDMLATAAMSQLHVQWRESTAASISPQVMLGQPSGLAYSLIVAYCTGLYSGAQVTEDPNRSYIFKMTPKVPAQSSHLMMYQMHDGGADPGWRVEFDPTSRPYYLMQKQLYESGVPSTSSSHSWTGVFNFTVPWNPWGECGFAKTLPIPSCTGCSGFCGTIMSYVNLGTVRQALQEQWGQIRLHLDSPLYRYALLHNESSVFVIIQRSREAPEQEGFLLAASNDPAHGCIFMYARKSPQQMVAHTAQAIYNRVGGNWSARPLQSSLFLMNFSLPEMKKGRSAACGPGSEECFDVSTRRIMLDDDLHWLVVLVLPSNAFTKVASAKQLELEKTVDLSAAASEDASHIFRVSFFVLSTAVIFGLFAAWFISALATYPLNKLQGYMHKLGRLDMKGLPGLHCNLNEMSSLTEVAELQAGFVNLARSVETFSRFVPETVVRSILHGDAAASSIHVQGRHATIMFTDIQSFTSIAETLSQSDLMTLLYMYLSEMTDIVERHGGVVSEILGDGLLILWNAPDDLKDHPVAACRAAVAQHKALSRLNEAFAEMMLPSIRIRIGLHTGDVLAGNIGSCKKMKYGCMGDPVNLASRLEGLAKHYGVGTLCSDATWASLPPNFVCRKLDLVRVKGKEQAVWVYELIDDMPSLREAAAQLYEDALHAFHNQSFALAVQLASSLAAQDPGDTAAVKLLQRADAACQTDLPIGWSPVMEMTEK